MLPTFGGIQDGIGAGSEDIVGTGISSDVYEGF